jgi:hypothetical protein
MSESLEDVLRKAQTARNQMIARKVEAAHELGLTGKQLARIEDGTEEEVRRRAEEIAAEPPEPEPSAEQKALAANRIREQLNARMILPPPRQEKP